MRQIHLLSQCDPLDLSIALGKEKIAQVPQVQQRSRVQCWQLKEKEILCFKLSIQPTRTRTSDMNYLDIAGFVQVEFHSQIAQGSTLIAQRIVLI